MRALFALVFVTSTAWGCATAEPVPAIAPAAPTVLAQLEASADLDGVVVGHADTPTIVVVLASWCEHCKAELHELDAIRSHPVRLIGVNYRGHEEYDHRGNSVAIRAFAQGTPWLRIVPIDDAMFDALGRPPLIPTIYIYDRAGALVQTFDRRQRTPPSHDELVGLLARLGA
jgi:thiol-disulfide isomerase/thioredoxin